ncbi:MAG: CopD family protein, partial [Chloroflexota bacterium]
PAPPEPGGAARNELDIPLRWLTLLASASVAGGFWFRQFVLRPAGSADASGSGLTPVLEAIERRTFNIVRIATVGLLVLGVVTLFNQAAQVGGVGLLRVMEGEVVTRLIMKTRYGLVWLARMMIIVGLLGVIEQLAASQARPSPPMANTTVSAPRPPPRSSQNWWWWLGGGMGLALLLTAALVSHAAGREPALLSLGADFVHQAGAAAWLGGLFCLTAAIPLIWAAPVSVRAAAVAALVPPFERLGVVAVVLVVGSGWLSAWQLVVTPAHLVDTPYGLTLLAKLALVAPFLGLAAFHHLIVAPSIRRHQGQGRPVWRVLPFTLKSEAAMGIGILIAAAVLAGSPPVAAVTPALVTTAAGQPETGVALAQQAGDLLVEFRLTPARPGANDLHIRLLDETGGAVLGAMVRLEAGPPGGPAMAVRMTPAGAGRDGYAARVNLGPGEWSITAYIQRPGRAEVAAFVALPVPPVTAAGLAGMAGDAMNRLTAMKERQQLRGSGGQTSVTEFHYSTPNAAAARGNRGEETITLGASRFSKGPSGSWTSDESPPEFAFRFPQFPYFDPEDTDFVLLRSEDIGGAVTHVVSYRLPRIDANFVAWIGASDHLIRRLTMLAPGHFMDAEFYDFNVPNDIRAPQ